ncbi:MAG: response regulator [Litoreibacter sp.]|nr:response regulator [Litoreibacter sp.]
MQSTLPVERIRPTQFQPQVIHALLVDDNEFDRKHIKRMSLRSDLNLQVTEARSIREMEVALQSKRFDLVLLDYNLEDGNGLEGLNLLRQNQLNTQTGIVMITGETQTEIAVSSFRGGCHDFVSKNGLSSEKMKDAILRSLTGARAQLDADLKSFIAETIEGSLRNANLINQIFEATHRSKQHQVIDGSAQFIEYLEALEHDEDDPFQFGN